MSPSKFTHCGCTATIFSQAKTSQVFCTGQGNREFCNSLFFTNHEEVSISAIQVWDSYFTFQNVLYVRAFKLKEWKHLHAVLEPESTYIVRGNINLCIQKRNTEQFSCQSLAMLTKKKKKTQTNPSVVLDFLVIQDYWAIVFGEKTHINLKSGWML